MDDPKLESIACGLDNGSCKEPLPSSRAGLRLDVPIPATTAYAECRTNLRGHLWTQVRHVSVIAP
jgi:hypothetical protein